MSESSYRTILRSSSIIGGAQVINIAVSLVKLKVVAVLLGPAGMGLVGLYLNLVQTASTISALGFGNVGTRQIATAQAEGGDVAVGRTRRALFWGTMGLALLGAAVFWALSGWIARVVLDDPSLAHDVAWLSLAVALTVAAGSQGALLTGLRRAGDLARINVLSGVAGAALGVAALLLWGQGGLLALVLVAPASTFMLGHLYVAKLRPPAGPPARLAELMEEWRVMARLGAAFMVSALIMVLGFLASRTLVQRELGAEALGQFQAAWAIGMTYLGFVLGAMGTDYYPRLTAAIRDRAIAVRLVNEQTEVALLLCAPVLVVMLGCAPYVIRLLYSAEFETAAEILRWQLLGDLLKVMSWPLGFILLASGAGKTFLLTETLAVLVFYGVVWIGLPLMGITATGVAFLALYAVYLPVVWLLGRHYIGFAWTRAVKVQAVIAAAAALTVEIVARLSVIGGAAVSLLLGAALGIWATMQLSAQIGVGGQLGKLAAMADRVKRWTTARF